MAPDFTATAVRTAIEVGYRLIDTAAVYANERGVGEGIRDSGIDRTEIFIETKVWISDYGYDETLYAFHKSAAKLGVETIDLLILHQPVPSAFEKTIAAYRALESLLEEGRVRAIGVSNFAAVDLQRLTDSVSAAPALNQVELHPYFQQPKLCAEHVRRGIATQAWSPIGGVARHETGGPDPLQDPVIVDIARSHRRSPAQVVLRWHMQRGRAVVPKSTRPERIRENFALADFSLSVEELVRMDELDTGRRAGVGPSSVGLAGAREIPEA